jgi:hypothetical protein
MKQILKSVVAVTVIMLMFASCKKAATVNGGSWTFKGQNYSVSSGIADVSQNSPVVTALGNPYPIASLSTVCQANNGYGNIVFTFWQYPTVSGSYPITSNPFIDSGSNAVAINMILSTGSNYAQKSYYPTSSSATTAMANVTVGSKRRHLFSSMHKCYFKSPSIVRRAFFYVRMTMIA